MKFFGSQTGFNKREKDRKEARQTKYTDLSCTYTHFCRTEGGGAAAESMSCIHIKQ